MWALAIASVFLAGAASATNPAPDAAPNVPVDDRDEQTLASSATQAFHFYLRAVDKPDLAEARSMVLDPGYSQGRMRVIDLLLGFVRARSTGNIRNEAVVVRTQGDWALAVYQYDTTINGQTTRVITTAWMIQWDGIWKQFLIEPSDDDFWDSRESDYAELQHWFDEHAEEIAS